MDELVYTYDKFDFRIPRSLRYSREDLWVRLEGERAVVGISDFLQQKAGDAAFVELAEVGTHLTAGERLGTLETIKATVILPSPLTGTVLARNEALEEAPERVNQDPYGDGWLVELRPDDPQEVDRLLTAEAYRELLPAKVAER
jgi:glycine cleavage system H protein